MKNALNSLWLTALILVTLVALTGCGQRGPLFLPDESSSSFPAEETTEENNDEENG
jgi:predicted small lipoprotein YifL